MQRFNRNLSVALVGIGVTLVGSAVFAKGGGSHSGGAHGGSSHAAHAHASHPHVSSAVRHVDSHKAPRLLVGNGISRFPNHPLHHHPHFHYHMHYPVGFWFGGHIEAGGIATVAGGVDVEFTKIRQLDAGDAAKNLAPAYRVWFHNNSDVDINQPFDVALLASADEQLSEGLPYRNIRVDGIAADETMSVDIRLPIEALSMSSDDGQAAPYAYVHTIIDSQRELVETDKLNNLSVDSREEIAMLAE